jgi:putative ATP-dependent endonuclease of OLD family
MKIKSLRVRHFRSILDETLDCEALTALVGANGSGKSAFLRALDLFYSPSPRVAPDDFYNRDTSQEIVITVTFRDLSPAARERFSSYLQGETLAVDRVFSWDGTKAVAKLHGSRLQNPDFSAVRAASSAAEKKDLYESLRQDAKYADLPKWKNQTDATNALAQWEAKNVTSCQWLRDEGKFFGFAEVGQGYLGDFTRFLFIPAVRDAGEDAADGKGSVLSVLMDLVVRSVVANRAEIKKLREDTQRQYKDMMNPEKLTELRSLEDDLSSTLKLFAPAATVALQWLPLDEVSIPMPKADVRLVEDGYACPVARTGHGLQRAFIMTLLQHLTKAQSLSDASIVEGEVVQKPKLPSLVLAIEEPELYQHPNRQRHLAKILLQLASGRIPGVAESTQIIYGTHSPLFVGIDRINQLRLLRKESTMADKPKITRIVSASLTTAAEELWEGNGRPGAKFTEVTLLPRLQTVMTPWMSEGFFADVVVLVEGEDDRAAILGVARALGRDLESSGISVIPCGGKTNIDRPLVIPRQLGIPVFVLWDGDKGDKNANPTHNHCLLRLLNHATADWPATQLSERFACFETNLEATLTAEIGEADFNKWLDEAQREFGIPKKGHALKKPAVVSAIVDKAFNTGRSVPTLRGIVEQVSKLKP